MTNICAIVDVQGFQFVDRFVAREVAICSEKFSQCQELNPRMNWRDLSEEDQEVVLKSTQFVHGLHFCPFNPVEHAFLYNSNEIGEIITLWYQMLSPDGKLLFAYKNQQMGKILQEANIPSVSLDDPYFGFPSYKAIQDKYGDNYLCSYHKKPRRNAQIRLRCAYRKANQLFRELKRRNYPEIILNEEQMEI